jgi:nicotinate dehydrogenase subunit B
MNEIQIEPERYELFERPAWKFDLDRREFLKVAASGIVVICLAHEARAQDQRRGRGGGAGPSDLGAWLHIDEKGLITVYTGKTEVGQNIRTSLAQAVAEELCVSCGSVRLVMADTDLVPFDGGTSGSRTTPSMAPQLRRAATAARELLLDRAASEWKVERGMLSVVDGKVADKEGRSVPFGELTKGQKLVKTIAEAPLTPASKWKVSGTAVPKVNGREMVTGAHAYTSDLRRPGMLFGRVLRPPSFGATLASVDLRSAESLGVTAVHDGEFVGVAGATSHAAARALEAIKAEWKTIPPPSSKDLFERLKKDGAGRDGEIDESLKAADVRLERTYTAAYIAHAPLEPRAAVAEWTDGRLSVWTGTQQPFRVRGELAKAFGLPEDRVRVIVPDTGSGYGGKHTGEAALEAARLAKSAGKPVKLVWTREEEFTWAYFRPAGVIDVRAGALRDGTLVAWECHNFNSGGSSIKPPYEIAHQKTQFHNAVSPLRQGSYRALAATANSFARESAVDELARELKIDPLGFRLKNLKDTRLRAVLEAAAERFGWDKRRGTGFGLACSLDKGSFVATCAEIRVNGGRVKVVRAVTAFECGAVVNPDHLKNQIEGAVTMGLGGALFEAIEFENGRITNPRFSRYRVPRFGDVPVLETVLLDRKDLPSSGAGETPIIAIAPAIGNAIFDATGERRRSLPLAPSPK